MNRKVFHIQANRFVKRLCQVTDNALDLVKLRFLILIILVKVNVEKIDHL